jgi:hypothetical protein
LSERGSEPLEQLLGLASPFGGHCLVMSYDRLVFDPAISLKPPPDSQIMDLQAMAHCLRL